MRSCINRYVAAYVGTAIVMVALDMLWLDVVARPLYQQGIGHLMAERPNVGVAVLFYLIYALGWRSSPFHRSTTARAGPRP